MDCKVSGEGAKRGTQTPPKVYSLNNPARAGVGPVFKDDYGTCLTTTSPILCVQALAATSHSFVYVAFISSPLASIISSQWWWTLPRRWHTLVWRCAGTPRNPDLSFAISLKYSLIQLFHIQLPKTQNCCILSALILIFSVTRRSRSDGNHWVTGR